MSKDYITVPKADGTTEQMEVVATFKLEEAAKNCIIYKSLNSEEYYAASYNDDLDYSSLNTDFSDKEKEQLNQIFKALNYGGEINA